MYDFIVGDIPYRCLEQCHRVASDAVDTQLKVEVRTGRPAGRTGIADQLTLGDIFSGGNGGVDHMTVDGLVAVIVLDPDMVAVSAAVVTGADARAGMTAIVGRIDDRTGIRRVDRSADGSGNIRTAVALIGTTLTVAACYRVAARDRPCPTVAGIDLAGSVVTI